MTKPFRFVARFLADQWRQFTPTGQLLYVMFIVAVCVDAGIAYQYGISMSGMHAAGFALVAVAFAVLPDIAAREIDRKSYYSALVIGAVCLPLGVTSYQSHIGYGAGVRLGDMQATAVQLTKVEDVRSSLTDERASMALWRKQLADLMAENDKIGAVNADGLRAQIKVKDEAIRQEERRGGCGPKCLALQQEKSTIEWKLGTVVKAEELQKRIQATQRILDEKTAVAIDTKPKHSVVVNQNTALGQLWHLVTGQEVAAATVNLAATGNASVAFLALAPILGFAAGRNRWRRYMLGTHEDDKDDDTPSASAPAPQSVTRPLAGIPSEPIHVHTVEHIKDATIRDWAQATALPAFGDQIAQMLGGGKQLKAA